MSGADHNTDFQTRLLGKMVAQLFTKLHALLNLEICYHLWKGPPL